LCDVGDVRWLAATAIVPLLFGAGCGSSEPDGRYVAHVDLAPLIRQLGAEEQADVDVAVERLAALGDAAVPALAAAVATEPRALGLAAIETLGEIGSPRSDDVLVGIAGKGPDVEVRATALLRLGEGGHAAARPVLEAALADGDPMVSHTAAVACGALCTSPEAIDHLIELGLRGIPEVELGRLRTTLARLLAGEDAAAAARVRDGIRARTAPVLAGAGPIDARARAALLAADAGVPDVEPVLVVAATDAGSTLLRLAAIQWLGRSGSAAAVPALRAVLADRSLAPGAAVALQSLARRGVPEARAAITPVVGGARPDAGAASTN
jgi:HEAT repeat protein